MFQEFLTVVKTASITLPAIELSLLLLVLTVCLVFRLTKIGLISAYLFAYKWGWVVFAERDSHFLMAYLIFGTAVGISTVTGMILSSRPSSE